MTARKFVIVIFAALALVSCAHQGHQFDMTKLDQLEPGVSTEDDAKKLFGEPESVVTNPQNNHQLLIWMYSHANLAASGAQQLGIAFDQNGKMLKVVQQSKI